LRFTGADDVSTSPDPDPFGDEHYGTVWNMADVLSMFTQQFDAARGALGRGDQESAAESLRSAVLVARSDPKLQRELASALLHLGKVSQKLGRAAEAEQLLSEALAISERLFGMEHPALGPLLNELSRLHIQQAHHARAEVALERLLGITRAKGEENADVATALAGLALVKRKLGDEASAEVRFREALRIREKVLAPNHMVIVVNLEQLSETCEARGNFADALAFLQRALPTREAAVGADHPTVRSLRSRIAALELRVAAPPANPNDLVFLYKPEPPARRSKAVPQPEPPPPRKTGAISRERPTTPTYTAAVAAASLIAAPAPLQIVPVAPIPVTLRESALASANAGRKSSAVHRDAVYSDVAHRDVTRGETARGGRRSAPSAVHADSHGPAPKKRTALYAAVGVAVAAIAIAVVTLRPGASGGGEPPSTQVSAEPRTAGVVATTATASGSTTMGVAAMAGAARADAPRAASVTPAPTDSVRSVSTKPTNTASAAHAGRRPPESAAAPALPSVPFVPFHVGTVNVPTSTTSVDSIVRSSMKRGRESYTDQIGKGVGVGLPTSVNTEEAEGTPPRIIGRAPLPRFPDELRSSRPEGEVIVRFKVDEYGAVDVGSMAVVKSDHELFTAAVREILPRFRFEPGRTAPPDSRPVAVWVNLPFKFTAKN
jgi:TonB family protein